MLPFSHGEYCLGRDDLKKSQKYRVLDSGLPDSVKSEIQNKVLDLVGERIGEDGFLSHGSYCSIVDCCLDLYSGMDQQYALFCAYRGWRDRENCMIFVRDLPGDVNNDLPGMMITPSMKLGDRRWRKRFRGEVAGCTQYFKDQLVVTGRDGGYLSNCAYMTFTVDPDRAGSVNNAWIMVKDGWDRASKRLHRRGIVDYLKVIECHGSGYPHVHVLVIFKDVLPLTWWNSGSSGRWILPDCVRDDLNGAWDLGFVDLFGVISPEKIEDYLIKDLDKITGSYNRNTWKRDLTFAWLSFTRTRWLTYSVGVEEYVGDLINAVCENSPQIMTDLEVKDLLTGSGWVFIGIVPRSFLADCGDKVMEYMAYDPPDLVVERVVKCYKIRHPDREVPIELLSLMGRREEKTQQVLIPFDLVAGVRTMMDNPPNLWRGYGTGNSRHFESRGLNMHNLKYVPCDGMGGGPEGDLNGES